MDLSGSSLHLDCHIEGLDIYMCIFVFPLSFEVLFHGQRNRVFSVNMVYQIMQLSLFIDCIKYINYL